MGDDLYIREAVPNDAQLIEALAKEIWTQHYTPVIGKDKAEYMLGKFQTADAIKADIYNGYVYYIAYVNEEPCGYTSVTVKDGAFLSKLYLKQQHRGKGIGKALYDKVLDFALQHGQHRIWLKCYKHNPTLDVYYSLGFKVAKNVLSDFGGGCQLDDYILEKML